MRKATIPITDDADVCNTGYIVFYNPSGGTTVQLQPDPLGSPVVLNNLEDDTEYEVEIYRKCCDGQISLATSFSFTSTITP